MKFNLSRRTKVIGGIVIGIMLILSGTVFALGKTGVINIGTLADTVVKATKQVVTPKEPTSSARITLTLPENIPAGTSIIIKNTTTGSIYSQAVTDPGNNIFTGNYTFNNITPGHYEGDESKCVRVYPFNVSADEAGGHSTGEVLASCTAGGSGAVCGDKVCAAAQHCNTASNACTENCTPESCGSNQMCNPTTHECENQNNHFITLYISIKTNCAEATCNNRDSYGKINGIPVSFGTFSGTTNNSLAQGYNLEFTNIMTGSYTFKINDPSANGYNPAYESKTVTKNTYTEVGSNIIIFELASKPAQNPLVQTSKFDLQGQVVDEEGKAVAGATITISCPDSPAAERASCLSHQVNHYNPTTKSLFSFYTSHGSNTNYLIKDVFYNIAQINSTFKSLIVTINAPIGYYLDNNNNNHVDANEQSMSFPIHPTDIKPSSAIDENSFAKRGVNLKKAPSDKLSLFGNITSTENNQMLENVEVKVSCTNNCGKGPWERYSSATRIYTLPSVMEIYNYAIQDIYNFKDDPTIESLKVEFIKEGYFYDANGNGQNDDQSASITINKDSIKFSELELGKFGYISQRDIKLTKKEKSYTVLGKINVVNGQDQTAIGGIKAKITGPNSYLEEKISENAISNIRFNDGPDFEQNIIFDRKDFKDTDRGYKLTVDLTNTDYLLNGQEIFETDIRFDAENTFYGSLDGSKMVYFFEYILKVKPSSATMNFSLSGEIKLARTYPKSLLKDQTISVKVLETDQIFTGTSSDTLEWPPTNPSANYHISDIPIYGNLQNGTNYCLTIAKSTFDDSTRETIPPDPFCFNSTDLRTNAESNSLSMVKNFEITYIMLSTKRISFKDAATNLPIDLSHEEITENGIFCDNPDNTTQRCDVSHELDKSDTKNSTMNYSFNSGKNGAVSLSLSFKTKNYDYKGGILDTWTDAVIYLIKNTNQAGSITCRNVNGIDFCSYKAIENEIFSEERMGKLIKYSLTIKTLAYYANIPASEYPDVYLYGPGEVRAFMKDDNNFNIGDLDSKQIFSMSNYDIDEISRGIYVVVHEFGHIIDFNKGLNQKYYEEFRTALKAARGENNDGSPIQDKNGQPIKSCNNLFSNYRCFSDYSITTNAYELWAEFFSFWILNNDQIANALNDNVMSKPENIHCKTTLMFLDSLMTSQFPKLTPFRQAPGKQAVGKNEAKSVPSNNFLEIMAEAGLQPAPTRAYNTIASLAEMTLEPKDIASGTWLQSNYNTLPLADKVALQINIAQTKATNLIASATANITTQLANINQSIENLMARLGIKITNTKIAGIVKDQNGPVEGMTVTFSNKVTVTDKQGKYSINRTKAGSNLKLSLADSKIDKNYASNPKILTIRENQQLLNTNLSFNRPSYQLKGKVYHGNNILVRGQLVIDGTQTVSLNAKGEFNFKLKEGQHKIIIRNNKGKTLTVSNPGKFGNLAKFKNMQNIDSLIWVK